MLVGNLEPLQAFEQGNRCYKSSFSGRITEVRLGGGKENYCRAVELSQVRCAEGPGLSMTVEWKGNITTLTLKGKF
jgi:hypothetical protein